MHSEHSSKGDRDPEPRNEQAERAREFYFHKDKAEDARKRGDYESARYHEREEARLFRGD